MWPYELTAYDISGKRVWQQRMHTFRPNETPGPSPAPVPSPSETPSAARSCRQRVFASMSEDQRVGQLFMVGLRNDRLGRARSCIQRWYDRFRYRGLASLLRRDKAPGRPNRLSPELRARLDAMRQALVESNVDPNLGWMPFSQFPVSLFIFRRAAAEQDELDLAAEHFLQGSG